MFPSSLSIIWCSHHPYPSYGVHIFLIHHMSFTSSLSIICMAFPSSLSIIQNFHLPYPLYSVPIFLIHYTAFPSSLSIIRRSHLPYPLNGFHILYPLYGIFFPVFPSSLSIILLFTLLLFSFTYLFIFNYSIY